MSEYIPGVCNINKSEIKKRQNIGLLSTGVWLLMLIVLVVSKMPEFMSFILFFPGFIAATGFLQARNRFCVGFANAQLQHAGEKTIKTSASDHKLDRKKSAKITAWSIVIGCVIYVGVGLVIMSLLN